MFGKNYSQIALQEKWLEILWYVDYISSSPNKVKAKGWAIQNIESAANMQAKASILKMTHF